MQVFEIKGLSGLILFLLGIISMLAVVLIGPALFMMVLWNAVVFEAFRGPEIDLIQGLLLWFSTLVLIKIIANPQISLQFEKVNDHDIDNHHFGE